MTVFKTTSVNFNKLAEQLTPMVLRTATWLAFVKALLTPIKNINADYNRFRQLKRRRMSYNGQIRLLENIVNQLMVGEYDMDAPAIYIAEPEPIEEFLISPNGMYQEQNSIHYDLSGKNDWNTQNHDPEENPEEYSILYDHTSRLGGIGFEVHLTPQLADDTTSSEYFNAQGGIVALSDIVDSYKLAGKQYVVIQDEE